MQCPCSLDIEVAKKYKTQTILHLSIASSRKCSSTSSTLSTDHNPLAPEKRQIVNRCEHIVYSPHLSDWELSTLRSQTLDDSHLLEVWQDKHRRSLRSFLDEEVEVVRGMRVDFGTGLRSNPVRFGPILLRGSGESQLSWCFDEAQDSTLMKRLGCRWCHWLWVVAFRSEGRAGIFLLLACEKVHRLTESCLMKARVSLLGLVARLRLLPQTPRLRHHTGDILAWFRHVKG